VKRTVELLRCGDSVESAYVEYTLTLRTSGGDALQIGVPFEFGHGGASRLIDPDDKELFGVVESLVGKEISRSVVERTGEILVEFEGGDRLTCGPDPDFEAWELVDSSGAQMVCLPGGGVAQWPSSRHSRP